MPAICKGDTVRVLRHRNAYGEDITGRRDFPFEIGDTFVVAKVDENSVRYPCPLVFPEGEPTEFWREDDLELVTSIQSQDRLAARVRELRDTRNIGLLEAKRVALREELFAEIDRASTIDDIKTILRKLA